MPGGGLLALVSYGSQNVILNGNPEFTYFYKVFKRHSHFAIENTTLPLEGPNQLFFDQPIKLRTKIPRIADLVTDLTFTFDLPDIYSKYVNTRVNQYEFQWNNYLGANIINNLAFYVGGSKIQEFDGDYIITKNHADLDQDTFGKWRYLIGDVSELIDPKNGAYPGGKTASGYPTVIPQANTPQQVNRPSISARTIYVPLPLWFSESIKKSLPLVALQYHECEIQITLRPIRELYSILDPSGYRVRPGFRVEASQHNIDIGQPTYISDTDPSGEFRCFLTDFGCAVPALNTWYINPRIQASYIYLTEAERKVFAATPLSYLVTQVTTVYKPNIYTRTTIDLEIGNPITRLLLVPRRSDSYLYRNQVENYTNWVNPSRVPWIPTPGAPNIHNLLVSSGLIIPNSQPSIINTLRIVLDGNEFQEEKPLAFYTNVQQYHRIIGGSTVQSRFLPIVNFSLTSPNDQPSGSINASRIRIFQIDINPWALPSSPSYVYELTTYVENINFFVVESGYGGIKYAL
jgi:Major capsid protein N-terminus/Large eukaryotic DNA virus major capsid protein